MFSHLFLFILISPRLRVSFTLPCFSHLSRFTVILSWDEKYPDVECQECESNGIPLNIYITNFFLAKADERRGSRNDEHKRLVQCKRLMSAARWPVGSKRRLSVDPGFMVSPEQTRISLHLTLIQSVTPDAVETSPSGRGIKSAAAYRFQAETRHWNVKKDSDWTMLND